MTYKTFNHFQITVSELLCGSMKTFCYLTLHWKQLQIMTKPKSVHDIRHFPQAWFLLLAITHMIAGHSVLSFSRVQVCTYRS